MADRKISQLPSGGLLQPGDLIPVARNGTNVTVLGGFLAPRKRGPWNSDTESTPAITTLTFPANAQIPNWTYKFNDTITTEKLPFVLGFDGTYSTQDPNTETNSVLASPDVGPGQNFSMSFVANASSSVRRLTINYSAMGEANGDASYVYDPFQVFVDSTEVLRTGGYDPAFKEFQYDLPSGQHTITLRFAKDFGGSDAGFDGFRISRISYPQTTFAIPYKFGDIVTYNGKTYSCQTNAAGIDSVPDKSPADWLLIPYDLTTDLDNLGNKIAEVDTRPPGLPYAYSGAKKFRHWRIGVASNAQNTTRLKDVSLRATVDQKMPQIASYTTPVNNQGSTFPVEWIDGNLDTVGYAGTFGNHVVLDIDFGTPQLIKVVSITPAETTGFTFFIAASEDGVTYTTLANRVDFSGTENVANNFNLNLPSFTGLTGYNLTANPQNNVGKFVKVNADGTGFDFGEVLANDALNATAVVIFGGNDSGSDTVPIVASTSPTSPNFALHEAQGDWVVIANVVNHALRPGVRAYTFQFSHTGDQSWPSIASWCRLVLKRPLTEEVETLISPIPHNVSGALDYHLTIFLADESNGNGYTFELQYLALSTSGGGTVGILNEGIQIVEWPNL